MSAPIVRVYFACIRITIDLVTVSLISDLSWFGPYVRSIPENGRKIGADAAWLRFFSLAVFRNNRVSRLVPPFDGGAALAGGNRFAVSVSGVHRVVSQHHSRLHVCASSHFRCCAISSRGWSRWWPEYDILRVGCLRVRLPKPVPRVAAVRRPSLRSCARFSPFSCQVHREGHSEAKQIRHVHSFME
ncbi:hypothetical protein V9T40_011853 [Parthenolecanium corni]|uniref:Uncharacterized protein n=1 Tax=Parthenolecanium corni TaxID=536013 RepID=A0AAN9XYT2_9HEMI